jgi:hypothetical protein
MSSAADGQVGVSISRKRKERHDEREHKQHNQRDGEEASHGV